MSKTVIGGGSAVYGRHKESFDELPESETQKVMERKKIYLVAFSALLFPLAMGTGAAFTSTGTDNMKRRSSLIHPSEDDVTWIGSLLAVGALFGGTIAGYVTERFGRKGAMMIYTAPNVAGSMFITYAPSVMYIFIGRFFIGMYGGAICAVTPAYLAEISPPAIRGILGGLFQVMVGVGAITGTSFGYFLDWRWQSIACSMCAVVALISICFMPESPRWLVTHGRYREAISALSFLNGSEFDAASECELMKDELSKGDEGSSIKPAELLKPEIYRPTFLAIGIIIFQQLCGANAILFYAVDVFKQSSSPIEPYAATILLHAVMTIVTTGSGYLLDRLGRKVMLISSGLGMALTLFILAGFDYAKSLNPSLGKDYSWVSLTDIMAFIMTFSFGYGPIPWLMISEISPDRARSFIAGTSSAFCWGFVFLITKSVDFLNSNLGHYGTYALYGSFCVISCVFTAVCLPETKGKRLEEIQKFFKKSKDSDDSIESLKSVG